jgi:hypothetical protein
VIVLALSPTNHSYIPRPDGDFDEWQKNLVDHLGKTWPVDGSSPILREYLGIPNGRWNALLTEQGKWNADFARGGKEADRKKSDTTAKIKRRETYERMLREIIAEFIRFNSKTTDEMKRALGLTVPDDEPSPVPAPTSHPVVITIDFSEPAVHRIRFKDEFTKGGARPDSAAYCEIVYIVRDGENPPDSVDDCTLRLSARRSPAVVHFSNADTGKRAFYFLRWMSKHGEAGPWSPMAHALIS